jgi:hypothetical protein
MFYNKGIEACEDIHIHHRTGYAFMTCGTEYERTQAYWPPSGSFNTDKIVKDTPYIYDIEVSESVYVFIFFSINL